MIASAFSGKGSGTESDPYQITTADELFEIRSNTSAYYKLMNDIDLGAWIQQENPKQGWTPIPRFSGELNGNGKSIIGLYINRSTNGVGFINNLTGAVTNITFVNPQVTGADSVGVVAGQCKYKTTVSKAIDCYWYNNISIINPVVKGNTYVGGVFGTFKQANIKDIAVIGGKVSGKTNVGGIYGHNSWTNGYYARSLYCSSDVETNILAGYSGVDAGGIIGYLYFNGSYYIQNCRFDGNVISTKSSGDTGAIYGGINNNSSNNLIVERNLFTGTVKGYENPNGLGAMNSSNTNNVNRYNVCALDTLLDAGSGSFEPARFSRFNCTGNCAWANTVVVYKGKTLEVSDNAYNGDSYSMNMLKKKTLYEGMDYDFENTWAMVDGETLPYNINQTTPVRIKSFVGGDNALLKGTSDVAGTLYVIVNGELSKKKISSGEWEVSLDSIAEGTKAVVSIMKEGMLASIVTTATATKGSNGGNSELVVDTIPNSDIANFENAIYIENTEVSKGGQATLSVKMKNTTSVQGYQFDIYLPSGMSFAKDADGLYEASLSTERTTAKKTNSFDSELQKDGALRVICYSTTGYGFEGNDGEVATIIINVDDTVADGSYPLIIRNASMSDVNNVSYSNDYFKSSITVSSYKLGDANGDGKIDIADITMTSNYILNREPKGFVAAAADVNSDNVINIADVTCISNYVLGRMTTFGASSSAKKTYIAQGIRDPE